MSGAAPERTIVDDIVDAAARHIAHLREIVSRRQPGVLALLWHLLVVKGALGSADVIWIELSRQGMQEDVVREWHAMYRDGRLEGFLSDHEDTVFPFPPYVCEPDDPCAIRAAECLRRGGLGAALREVLSYADKALNRYNSATIEEKVT